MSQAGQDPIVSEAGLAPCLLVLLGGGPEVAKKSELFGGDAARSGKSEQRPRFRAGTSVVRAPESAT